MKCLIPVTICLGALLVVMGSPCFSDDWPQWRGPNRDGVWRETGIVETFDAPQIKLKWKTPIASGYSGPTVAHGRVYVTDRKVDPKQIERVHCLDWQTGEILWTHPYDCTYKGIGYEAGPRASVLVDEGRAYSLGTAGHLFCFDAATGDVLWNHDLYRTYHIRMPNWGVAASPLVEGDLLIVHFGGDHGACVAAFNKKNGKEVWKALPDDASYSAPIVVDHAGERVLVVWTGNRIVGMSPHSGKVAWEIPSPWEKWPIAIATPVQADDLLFFSETHRGSILLQMRRDRVAVDKRWHRRSQEVGKDQALHCLISTPMIQGQHIYAADNRGVLRCLDVKTGEVRWQDRTAVPENSFATIHLVKNGNRVWMFNERGELIISRLTPERFIEISRAKLLAPTTDQLRRRDGVTWSHPAFAYRHVFARNDKEIVCADLSAK
ncbi:MAG: PQQ-binding-like beta-propeller repeat protein [Pirellulaceae bacterium]